MNELIINEIQKNKNRIDICYDIKGDWNGVKIDFGHESVEML